MATLRAPSPRFRRSGIRPNVQLTADDEAILWAVLRHRIIDSRAIYRLLAPRSEQVISRRLRRLWEAGYLDRPIQQNEKLRMRTGSDPLVYAIGREGAQALRATGLEINTAHWAQKNREIKGRSIQHALSTTRYLVDLECSATGRGAQLHHIDTLGQRFPKLRKRQRGVTLTLRSQVDWHDHRAEEGTAPDRIVSLVTGEEEQFLLLEIDAGTETVEPSKRRIHSPSFFRDTSILRKLVVYASAFRSGAHRQQFGLPVFRVLFVTTSAERVARMQEAYQRHLQRGPLAVPPGLFLFTDWETLTQASDTLVDVPLHNGAGKAVALLR